MDDQFKNTEIKKIYSEFRKRARIRECFCFDKNVCKPGIISAHSIQKSGRLSILEEKLNVNNVIFSTLNRIVDNQGILIGFEPLGKNIASTFFGFCSYHDNELFKEIENNEFDKESDLHCFLHSYRSFAHEYHVKQEVLKGFLDNNKFTSLMPKEYINESIKGSELAIRDMDIVKKRLNNLLNDKNFSELEYFVYEIDGFYPIATSTAFSPEYSIYNKVLNKSLDANSIYETVILTLLPGLKKTTFIFACLPENEKSLTFIDDLNNLPNQKLNRVLSSIIISYAENTFFSPSVWHKMNYIEKANFMEDIRLTNPVLRQLKNCFYNCHTNLFDDKFRKKIFLTKRKVTNLYEI